MWGTADLKIMFGDTILTQNVGIVCRASPSHTKIPDGCGPAPGRQRRGTATSWGGMGSWTLDDIPWDRFDRDLIDPELIGLVKAASLVEYNGAAYARHLCHIFDDDAEFQNAARHWGEEEIQHGLALARWAALA